MGGTGEGRFDHRLAATSWVGLPDCTGCGLCAEACPENLVRIEGGKAVRCVHCDPNHAPCAEACPCLAIVPKGRTLVVEEDACTGCGLCAEACPIDAVRVTDRAVKCDNCIDKGPFPPPCVEACPVPEAATFAAVTFLPKVKRIRFVKTLKSVGELIPCRPGRTTTRRRNYSRASRTPPSRP